jgi:glycolate oxidase
MSTADERFGRITAAILDGLRSAVGRDNVLADAENMEQYAHDETEDLRFPPDVVVRPESTEMVAAVMRIASRHRIPVTPRGGGTGLSGGALPVFGGIVLSMERFARIRSIDTDNCQALVEPGVITQLFQEEVARHGLYYPPDPASRGSCHLGGNVAEGAGGPHAVKYGTTREYVLGLEAVLPSGEVLTTGAAVLKNATGYNLTQLLVGSEGTLAVITAIRLRLIPLPRFRKVALVAFPSLEAAAGAVAGIFQRGITPAALEILERAAVRVAEERLGKKFPLSDAEAQLVIEVDGNHEESVEADLQAIADVVGEAGALDVLLALERSKIEEVWNLRRGIGEAVKSISAYKEEDTVVPRAQLPALIRGVKEICSRYGITSICYGHAGDGNVHVNILKGDLDERVWHEEVDKAIREIFHLTVSLGGTVSGEHGIGYVQKAYLPIAVGKAGQDLMRGIKAVFDPQGILNPGKILP